MAENSLMSKSRKSKNIIDLTDPKVVAAHPEHQWPKHSRPSLPDRNALIQELERQQKMMKTKIRKKTKNASSWKETIESIQGDIDEIKQMRRLQKKAKERMDADDLGTIQRYKKLKASLSKRKGPL